MVINFIPSHFSFSPEYSRSYRYEKRMQELVSTIAEYLLSVERKIPSEDIDIIVRHAIAQ